MGLAESIYKTLVGTDESVLDPATGLTIKQKRLLTESWSIIKKNQKKYGVALFLRLLRTYPETQRFFPSFREIPPEDLPTSPLIRAHSTTIMYQVGSFVDNLEDPECLVGILQKTATNHHKRGVGPKEFGMIRSCFGPFLDEQLGSQATPELKEAWDKLLSVLCSVVESAWDGKEKDTQKT